MLSVWSPGVDVLRWIRKGLFLAGVFSVLAHTISLMLSTPMSMGDFTFLK